MLGLFFAAGIGNLVFIDENMTGELYCDILQKNLFQSVNSLKMNKEWVFQHNNDPKHTAAIVKNCLKKERVEQLKWPSFSPDTNPIEHLWDTVEKRMKKEQPHNAKELKENLLRVWSGMEKEVLKKLVDSVPNRLNEEIRMKGYPIKY